MADMDFVRRAMAAEARAKELEREVERLKQENAVLREQAEYWRWKTWLERTGKRRLDWEDEPGVPKSSG